MLMTPASMKKRRIALGRLMLVSADRAIAGDRKACATSGDVFKPDFVGAWPWSWFGLHPRKGFFAAHDVDRKAGPKCR